MKWAEWAAQVTIGILDQESRVRAVRQLVDLAQTGYPGGLDDWVGASAADLLADNSKSVVRWLRLDQIKPDMVIWILGGKQKPKNWPTETHPDWDALKDQDFLAVQLYQPKQEVAV